MIIKQALVFLNGQFTKIDVRVENGVIAEIGTLEATGEVVDGEGKLLLPGLLEIHSHGCVGEDFSTSDEKGVEKMRRYYLENGITSVLATTMTEEPGRLRRAMETIDRAAQGTSEGCRILGINMEGPFLSPAKKGAHDEQYLKAPSAELLEELDALSGHRIKLVDLAPELPGGMEFIRKYAGKKVLSLAHTGIGYDEAIAAFDAGANHVTHLFNAMNDPKHREPGIVGAVCDRENVFAEFICDGIHNHPSIIRMMFAACPEKLVLISDSMSACGMPDGDYELGGLAVTVQNGKATLKDGTIAGSAVNVFTCMKRVVSFGVPLEQAVAAATQNPAKSIGVSDQYGVIRPGAAADLLLTTPDLALCQVWLGGVPQK